VKTWIHVDQQVIRRNLKKGTDDPPITVRTYKDVKKVREVKVKGGKFVYRPEDPLSCGARLWFETDEPVEIIR
jgi:hypothetical protein